MAAAVVGRIFEVVQKRSVESKTTKTCPSEAYLKDIFNFFPKKSIKMSLNFDTVATKSS